MSTWEGRMAARAQARALARAAEPEEVDEHAGHHRHLNGTMVECSCGEDFGVTCVAFPEFESAEQAQEWFASLACEACGKPGVTMLG